MSSKSLLASAPALISSGLSIQNNMLDILSHLGSSRFSIKRKMSQTNPKDIKKLKN